MFDHELYCESLLSGSDRFPSEILNTYSNLAIVTFAVIAFWSVYRSARQPADLYVLCCLLFINGLMSFFWHGFRTHWALVLDVLTGLAFLLGLFFSWPRRLMRHHETYLFFFVFILTNLLLGSLVDVAYGQWLSILPSVMLFGGYLSYRSGLRVRSALYMGLFCIGLCILAISFRAYDAFAVTTNTCDVLPSGTHFLWHISLSLAALIAIQAMLMVDDSEQNGKRKA